MKEHRCKYCGCEDFNNFYGNNKSRCKDCYREKYAEKHTKIREQILDLLGGRCTICGLEDRRALQVDHIEDNGADERRSLSGAKYYSTILAKVRAGSKEYQLLCANCNAIKEWEHSSIRKSSSLLN